MYYCSIEQKYIFFIVKKAYTSGVINKYAHLGRGPPRSIGKFAYNKFLFCFKFMYEKLCIYYVPSPTEVCKNKILNCFHRKQNYFM